MRTAEEGLSLVEVLVAAALIGIALVPLLQLYPRTLESGLESERNTILSAAAVRKMEELITLLRVRATPGKKFYLHQEASALSGNWLAKDGVAPEVIANEATEMRATMAAGTFILFMPGVRNQTTGTPSTTPQGVGWWSSAALNETLPVGAWTLALRKRSNTSLGSTMRFHVRVYRVPQNTSITGAVQLFSTTGPNFTSDGTRATISWTTASVGPFTFANEYLLVEAWLEAVTTQTAQERVRLAVEGSNLVDAGRSTFTTPAGSAVAVTSGTAACADLPNCRLVWTITTELSSTVTGVGTLKTVQVVACEDNNANSTCDTGEKQVRYDAKVTSRP